MLLVLTITYSYHKQQKRKTLLKKIDRFVSLIVIHRCMPMSKLFKLYTLRMYGIFQDTLYPVVHCSTIYNS